MPRAEYESFQREKSDSAVEIRQKLHDTFLELADQAHNRREWEAASAFQYAAGLALGMVIRIDIADRK